MLLRLRKRASNAELEAVRSLAAELGYAPRFLGDRHDLLQLDAVDALAGGPDHPARFLDLSVVAEVLDRGDARERWQSATGRDATVVDVVGTRFGAGHIGVIAGPCAVEDPERLFEVARGVRDAGATLLRGGAFKPRTSPYSFQGLGASGLELLAEARAETGLGIVTEVLDPRDVAAVADVADMVQVGARSMASYALLKELGQLRKPVLLKRSFGATVSEWMGAAEYLLAGGNEDVVLCERGVRGFDTVTRGLLDVGAIAHLAEATHLPVIADPSHAAGRADLVPRIARAGLAAGADGLMVEVHTHPEEAHSDGRQAIDLGALAALVREAAGHARLRDELTADEAPASRSSLELGREAAPAPRREATPEPARANTPDVGWAAGLNGAN